MRFPRRSGVLLHPTCLPGPFGIGDLGPEAYRFADWLVEAGCKLWQVLPLGPTGYGDSPYQCFSAFAGNPLLISPELLVEDGWLQAEEIAHPPEFPAGTVRFESATPYKEQLLHRAFERFRCHPPPPDFVSFRAANSSWLEPYCRYMALKSANDGLSWTEWDVRDNPDPGRVAVREFWQYLFFRQWFALKRHCVDRGIALMGDMPIYVAHDSADVWAAPELFRLDSAGRPTALAGVPPDYFSSTGQLWGNPIYRWDALAESGYKWWIERFRHTLNLFDMVRLDHFRGFEAYWEVPAGEETAVNGRWVKGPGAAFFESVESVLGNLPVVAENLGVITPEVERLRERLGYPGMSILQFAFGSDPQGPSFRPHNYPRHRAAYSGTHDNDTTAGWWSSKDAAHSTRSAEELETERAFARRYLHFESDAIHDVFIRTLIGSVADTVIFPLQDLLGLGSEARMNSPGRAGGNWRWRNQPGVLTPGLAAHLRELNETYDR